MSDNPISLTQPPVGYADWLADLKGRIHTAQQRATLAFDRKLVQFQWYNQLELLDIAGSLYDLALTGTESGL